MRLISRTLACSATAAAAVLALAAPAVADVEVGSDRPRQGSENATLNFTAEAQSHKAGITSLRVRLPKGLTAKDVTLISAPPGWTMRHRKGGYEVKGPELGVGENAHYSVRVDRLPTGEPRLVFATAQRYANGRLDRWVELPEGTADGKAGAGGSAEEPGHPAPVLELAAADTATAGAPDGRKLVNVSNDSSRGSGTLIGVSIAVLLAAGFAAWWLLRRRRSIGGAHYRTPDQPPATDAA